MSTCKMKGIKLKPQMSPVKNGDVMKSMSNCEIDTLVNLLRWLENRGTIIIVENNIADIHKEIRQFNPNVHVHSTYQSLNPDLLVPKVELKIEADADQLIDSKRSLWSSSTSQSGAKNTDSTNIQTHPAQIQPSSLSKLKKKTRGRKRITTASKLARKKRKAKQEEEDLALALAEATRGTYIGKLPRPNPSALLLLRKKRNYRHVFNCTMTDISKIPVKLLQLEMTENPTKEIAEIKVKVNEPEPPPTYYKCDECDKTLKTKSSLKSHKITHSNLKQLICEICAKTFNHARGLKRHLIWHEGIRKYVCDHCPASFIFPQKLKDHELTHSGLTRVNCDVCNRGFVSKKHLQTHQVVHSDERPFVCSICKKAFRRISHLKQHFRLHTGEKPWKCLTCGKGFVQQASLHCHNKTHHNSAVVFNVNTIREIKNNETHVHSLPNVISTSDEITNTGKTPPTITGTTMETNSENNQQSYNWKSHLSKPTPVSNEFPPIQFETILS